MSSDTVVAEVEMTADQLREKYDALAPDGGWGWHPDYPRNDWAYEMANGDTRLGYWDWVCHRIEMNADDSDEA